MIITADEYRDMGFTASDSDELERCLQRAEYTIAGLTEGRYESALAAGGKAAEYVKQAAAFQTRKLVQQEEQIAAASGNSEKVTIGDYSYSASSENSTTVAGNDDCVFDMSMQTIRLLRAAGCLFGGREVR